MNLNARVFLAKVERLSISLITSIDSFQAGDGFIIGDYHSFRVMRKRFLPNRQKSAVAGAIGQRRPEL